MLGNKYRILGKLGKGNFGSIYRGINIRTQEEVAIKIGPESSLLKHETQVYQYLGKTLGFPTVKWFGLHNNNFYMVLTMLGHSLSFIKENAKRLSLPMALAIGRQMIERLEYIHGRGLIHRDVKPDNFLLGRKELSSTIHLIDFGFCKRYTDNDGQHIPMVKDGSHMIGTPNFVSIHILDGITPSRRDDIESCIYIILYLITESWTDISREKKLSYRDNPIVPENIRQLLSYCDTLEFDETPDYEAIKLFL
jgi:serine/threonine protein kinase